MQQFFPHSECDLCVCSRQNKHTGERESQQQHTHKDTAKDLKTYFLAYRENQLQLKVENLYSSPTSVLGNHMYSV